MNKILPLLLFAGLLLGCRQEDPNSPPALRKALFKQMLSESENLSGMLRGRIAFNPERFSQGAEKLAQLSKVPWQYFPLPDEKDKNTNAQASIWQKQARFAQLARNLEVLTEDLQQISQQTSLSVERLSEPMQRVEQACKACHQEFRRF